MKLISFNCTIEVNKDKDGYSNHVYIDVNKDNVHLTQPYTNLDAETAAFITKLEHDFINHSIDFNRRIDGFNRDNHLEQYAPRAIKTEETTSEVSAESASEQPERGGSEGIDGCRTPKEETVIAAVRGSANEGLTVIGE